MQVYIRDISYQNNRFTSRFEDNAYTNTVMYYKLAINSSEFDGRGGQSSHRHYKLFTINVEGRFYGYLSLTLRLSLFEYISTKKVTFTDTMSIQSSHMHLSHDCNSVR